MIPSSIAYGRLPHDPERVAALPFHVAAEAPPPLEYPVPLAPWTPTLAGNLTLPTCSVAGLANSARRWALAQRFDLDVPDQKLWDLYAAVAGCAPTPESIAITDGLVLIDLLNYVSKNGLNYGGPGPVALIAYRLDPADLTAMRAAINGRQSVYLGVNLYQDDVVPGLTRWTGAPVGSFVGGHCICGWRFQPGAFGEATWGEDVPCDETWMLSRVEEAYALAWVL